MISSNHNNKKTCNYATEGWVNEWIAITKQNCAIPVLKLPNAHNPAGMLNCWQMSTISLWKQQESVNI